ncbi:MAG: choice-of-anchor K domain-containing protein [Verrucomicrobiales bacterium]
MKAQRGFSLVELVITVGVVGILAALGIATFSNLVGTTKKEKLTLDIATLNRSITAYIGAGGDLSKAKSPEEVLTALKKEMKSASRVPTLSGSKVDERLTFALQTAQEGSSNSWRAYWDSGQQKFVLQQGGNTPGIKGLVLDPSATKAIEEDENTKSSMLYAEKGGWIWDYEEVPPGTPPGPSTFGPTEVPDTAVPTPPTGPGGGPSASTALLVPQFSVGSGAFPITQFNLPVSITNPNPAGSSTLYYSVDFGTWKSYSGPLSVPPGSVVTAQAIANSDLYTNSGLANESYSVVPAELIPPIISPNRPVMGIFTDRVLSVTLTDQNSSSISRLQYRIGGDPWQDYKGPFSVSRDDFPTGALVQARAIPLDPYYLSSTTTLRTLGVEAASISGNAAGTFSNPEGESGMVSSLNKAGTSSDYFSWGRDKWTGQELASFGGASKAPVLSKSWLDYNSSTFSEVGAGERFQIGSLTYYNGTIAGGSGADKISFATDLQFALSGVNASTTFNFDFELINVANQLDPANPWADADFVRLANPVASQRLTFNGVEFEFQLEFGETTSSGISYFDEFHVLESKSATTKLYGTLIEVGSISFNK